MVPPDNAPEPRSPSVPNSAHVPPNCQQRVQRRHQDACWTSTQSRHGSLLPQRCSPTTTRGGHGSSATGKSSALALFQSHQGSWVSPAQAVPGSQEGKPVIATGRQQPWQLDQTGGGLKHPKVVSQHSRMNPYSSPQLREQKRAQQRSEARSPTMVS